MIKQRWTINFLVFFLVLLSFVVEANVLPENHSVNGGLTIIPIDIKRKPEAYYQSKKIIVLPSQQPNQWLLIVGIPLDREEAIQNLKITNPYRTSVPFHVSKKFYTTQALTISNQRLVDPNDVDKQRIEQETKEQNTIYANYTTIDPFAEGFKAPSHGPISSFFGLKRIYNKQSRPPHSGLDIAAPENSPVYAAAKGKVVSTKDYFFTGNTVIIDHGMGVFSLYGHLNRIDVKQGATVSQGDQLGLVGKTGRATGPHLHWSMIMNQTLVDPLLFVPMRVITTS